MVKRRTINKFHTGLDFMESYRAASVIESNFIIRASEKQHPVLGCLLCLRKRLMNKNIPLKFNRSQRKALFNKNILSRKMYEE